MIGSNIAYKPDFKVQCVEFTGINAQKLNIYVLISVESSELGFSNQFDIEPTDQYTDCHHWVSLVTLLLLSGT